MRPRPDSPIINHSSSSGRGPVARMRGGAGFPLVALLVVIPVMAISAAIRLAAVSRAQKKAREIRCIGSAPTALTRPVPPQNA